MQLVTRPILAGSQETLLLIAAGLNSAGRYRVDVASGIQTGPEGSIVEEMRARGIEHTVILELVREVRPLLDVRAFLKLRRHMRERRYDIVHTNGSKAGILGRFAAKWAGVSRVVHTVHGWSFHDHMPLRRKRLYVWLERLAARYTDRLIVVSPSDMEKGLAHGVGRREQYRLVRSGIELDRFRASRDWRENSRQEFGIPDDAVVIGCVLRMSPQKAPLDLVDAFAKLAARQPRAWLVMVGDGPLRPQVERRIDENGIGARTVLTGLRRDVPKLMPAFDVFALSSLWEGLPRVIPQAMATGLPVVCTRADGSAEAVAHGETGFLVEPGNTDALAERIEALISDPSLRERMGAEALRRVPEFGSQRMLAGIDSVYRELVG